MTASTENRFGGMLKSSLLLAAASVINVVLGAIRTKFLAVQLGPELFGVMGLYTTLMQMIQSIASLGLNQSAIREIAAAAGSKDSSRIARCVRAYQRIVLVTGCIGMVLTLCAAYPASLLTFHNRHHTWTIATLSIVVFFSQIQAGQNVLFQGLRRIGDLAAISISSGILSTMMAIPIALYFKQDSIVPFLLAASVGQVLATWWYARRVQVQAMAVSWRETWELSRSMLKLGLAFVVSGIATTVSAYAIRLTINDSLGEAAVGLYQSAFTISGIYIGFILQAMGSDYYPRLAGISDDDRASQNQLVNEQTIMALYLAVPGLISALVLSDVLIWTMYSSRFAGASGILRWQVLGLLGRIISWPMGFILLARSDSKLVLLTEISTAIVHVCLVWICVTYFGFDGAGIAYAVLYLYYLTLIYWVVHFRHGYAYSASTRATIWMSMLAVGLSFAATFIPIASWRICVGMLLMIVFSFYCFQQLLSLIPEIRPAIWWKKICHTLLLRN